MSYGLLFRLTTLPLGSPTLSLFARSRSGDLHAFYLEIRYDKVERRIEISAAISEAVARTFQNAKDLPEEVSAVALRDIAGARFVPPSDARIVERMRLAA